MLNDDDIKIHLAAGRYYGFESTCGSKIKWRSFEQADATARKMTEKYKRDLEAYPCYFCSPDKNNEQYFWHTGRKMDIQEWATFSTLADDLLSMDDAVLVGGQTIRCHNPRMCEGRNCCVHNPSDHRMATWTQNWREDRKIMERICSHGIGHPDPDDVEFQKSIGRNDTVHGCDGCCYE